MQTEKEIIIANYPLLKIITWDFHCESISEKTAFSLYERRWGFCIGIDMIKEEKELLNRLIKTYGNGVFLPS